MSINESKPMTNAPQPPTENNMIAVNSYCPKCEQHLYCKLSKGQQKPEATPMVYCLNCKFQGDFDDYNTTPLRNQPPKRELPNNIQSTSSTWLKTEVDLEARKFAEDALVNHWQPRLNDERNNKAPFGQITTVVDCYEYGYKAGKQSTPHDSRGFGGGVEGSREAKSRSSLE